MNSRGFTLIEILVVMVLIAVSGSLVYLSVGRSAEQKQGKLFAQEMIGLVKKSQTHVPGIQPTGCVLYLFGKSSVLGRRQRRYPENSGKSADSGSRDCPCRCGCLRGVFLSGWQFKRGRINAFGKWAAFFRFSCGYPDRSGNAWISL